VPPTRLWEFDTNWRETHPDLDPKASKADRKLLEESVQDRLLATPGGFKKMMAGFRHLLAAGYGGMPPAESLDFSQLSHCRLASVKAPAGK
jgi:hypothetical protein